jgi:GH25 family lysozyme M1 (1,4-beta-N-acetylmuramidase)
LKLVLDVSNNAPIDTNTLERSGAVALIAKATEGASFQDKTLSAHRGMAGKLKKPFGSYLFLHPNSSGSEAAFYLKYARPRRGDIQPIIDAEVTNLGTAELARRVESCALALEREGYKPLLYASAGIWTSLIAAQPRLRRLRIWEAQYPGRFTRWLPRFAKLRIRLRHGVTVVMWQWTDAYAVGSRHYDASVLLASLDSILIPDAAPAGVSRRVTVK